jgi:hypothetical protein
MRRLLIVWAAALVAAGLAGCGERSHSESAVAKRAEQPAWDAAADPFVVPGWKSGDKASWQEQMTKRAQNQNEYLRGI